jgi:hypothetical protein
MDPRGAVHATCGLLPVKAIDIPPELFAPQLADLRVTFRTRPVLTDPDGVALPLPGEPGAAWSWIERDGERWHEVPHHPTLRKAAFMAGFGEVGADLWTRLVALGRLRIVDRGDVALLVPAAPADDPAASAAGAAGANVPVAPPTPATNPYADLKLDPAAVERGLHDLAEAIADAGIEARYGPRPVIHDGWLQLRAEPIPAPRAPEATS